MGILSKTINSYVNNSSLNSSLSYAGGLINTVAGNPVVTSSIFQSPAFTGTNLLNASITGLFTAFSNIAQTFSAQAVYKEYQKQEQLQLESAAIQARRLQLKGDISLANLRVKHALAQGEGELSAAAAGGRLSGSALDVLTANRGYALRDERSQQLDTLWAVDEAKRQGFINAIQTASQAKAFAYQNRSNALRGLTNMVSTMVGALGKDVEKAKALEMQQEHVRLLALGYQQDLKKYQSPVNMGSIGDTTLNLNEDILSGDTYTDLDNASVLKLNSIGVA